MQHKNLFIAFEGIDGSGKSTQVRMLAQRLEADGHKIYSTFEPTDSEIGKMIRAVFSGKMIADHKVIAALFLADRLNHILNKNDGLLKKLEEGYTVLTDRYYFSSYAYHGAHMDMDWVIQANTICADLLRPDLNIFIDMDPDVCMERINQARTSIELYETLENLKMVQSKYEEAFEKLKDQETIFRTNGNLDKESIATTIYREVNNLLSPKNC